MSRQTSSSRIATVPNVLSAIRILLIPAFVVLIVDDDTTVTGLILFALVAATDWVDGWLARRTGQVSDLGKVLDPTADRLAIAAGIIALAVRGVFPWWAAALILVRDVAMLAVAGYLLFARRVRIDVRFIGKLATFTLIVSVFLIPWGVLGQPLAEAALAIGWSGFGVGIVEYYAAAGLYVGDARRAIDATSRSA